MFSAWHFARSTSVPLFKRLFRPSIPYLIRRPFRSCALGSQAPSACCLRFMRSFRPPLAQPLPGVFPRLDMVLRVGCVLLQRAAGPICLFLHASHDSLELHCDRREPQMRFYGVGRHRPALRAMVLQDVLKPKKTVRHTRRHVRFRGFNAARREHDAKPARRGCSAFGQCPSG